MKKFENVKIGNQSIDYNGEKGIVTRKAKKGEPEFDELVSGWAEEAEELGIEEAIEIEGPEYGAFGGFGKVSFSYGYDGAYVPKS